MTFFGIFRPGRRKPPKVADLASRPAKVARWRQQAFGPPMTQAERKEFERLVEAQRKRD